MVIPKTTGEAAAVTDDAPYTCASEPAGQATPYKTATPNARGNWEIGGGLLEGNYEVVVDLPRSYAHATNGGATTGTTAGTDGYYETQVVTLNSGRRSEDGSEDFHIVLDGADNTDAEHRAHRDAQGRFPHYQSAASR